MIKNTNGFVFSFVLGAYLLNIFFTGNVAAEGILDFYFVISILFMLTVLFSIKKKYYFTAIFGTGLLSMLYVIIIG